MKLSIYGLSINEKSKDLTYISNCLFLILKTNNYIERKKVLFVCGKIKCRSPNTMNLNSFSVKKPAIN